MPDHFCEASYSAALVKKVVVVHILEEELAIFELDVQDPRATRFQHFESWTARCFPREVDLHNDSNAPQGLRFRQREKRKVRPPPMIRETFPHFLGVMDFLQHYDVVVVEKPAEKTNFLRTLPGVSPHQAVSVPRRCRQALQPTR